MNIPDQFYQLILKEFKEVQILCNEAKSIEDKLYFFTASYGIVNRVINFHYDPTLVFIHQVLQTAYQNIHQRLSSPKNPGVVSNSLPNEIIDSLFKYYGSLIIEFEKKDSVKIREVLEKFSSLTYATSGNGFYLYLREKLTI